jgi:hypothetical protein
MKRSALVCALFTLCVPVWAQSIPLGEIIGDDRSIRDQLYRVSARYPAGWMVRGITRWGDKETTIYFGAPSPSAFATLYYRVSSVPMSLSATAEDFFREEARKKEEQRVNGGLADYANVVPSFEYKTIGGQPALANTARFTGGGGKTQCEYFVRVMGASGTAVFFLRSPLEEFDQLRPAFDGMIETIHLP